MTPLQIKALCQEWKQNHEVFQKIIAAALSGFGASQRELAREFEVAESTVSRWAAGIVRPHSNIQKLVVEWVSKRAQKVITAQQKAQNEVSSRSSCGSYSVAVPMAAKNSSES